MRANLVKYLGSSVVGPLAAMLLAALAVGMTTNRFFQAENLSRGDSLQFHAYPVVG